MTLYQLSRHIQETKVDDHHKEVEYIIVDKAGTLISVDVSTATAKQIKGALRLMAG